MIARLSDYVNTNGKDEKGKNVRSYNWAIRWGHADTGLVAWRYTVYPELMEVLMTMGCYDQERQSKHGVQHSYKFTELKEGKMNPGGWQRTASLL